MLINFFVKLKSSTSKGGTTIVERIIKGGTNLLLSIVWKW